MTEIGKQLFSEFNSKPAATDEQIASAESALNVTFPADYVQFLKKMNGGEGSIGESYAVLWEVSELASRNEAHESSKWAPGFLIFGSDGGGEAFGFDTRKLNWPIVRITFVGMNWKEAQPLGNTFAEFVENLNTGSWL